MRSPSSYDYEAPECESSRGAAPPTYVFDRAGARSVDRAAIEECGIPGLVLMENAARGLCAHALTMLGSRRRGAALIICGSGNNGGDGYAVARHLHNAHVEVVIAAVGEPRPESDAGINRAICVRMGLMIAEASKLPALALSHDIALIVDALFGTGLERDITGAAAEIVEWINATHRPVLAADVPSGLDCDTGRPLGACVKATKTVTFVGLKQGFLECHAQPWLGEVVVAGIGAPRELLERYGRRVITHHHEAPEHDVAQLRSSVRE